MNYGFSWAGLALFGALAVGCSAAGAEGTTASAEGASENVAVQTGALVGSGSAEFWVGTSDVEAKAVTSSNCVVSGVGAWVRDKAVQSLWLQQACFENSAQPKKLTWRANNIVKVGRNATGMPEVMCNAPLGHVVVGVGARIKDGNMRTLVLHHRRYDEETGRLVGGTRVTSCEKDRAPTDSHVGVEKEIILADRIAAGDDGPEDDGSLTDRLARAVVTGVGLREKDDNVHSLGLTFRYLTR